MSESTEYVPFAVEVNWGATQALAGLVNYAVEVEAEGFELSGQAVVITGVEDDGFKLRAYVDGEAVGAQRWLPFERVTSVKVT